jgi:hypothetical protein
MIAARPWADAMSLGQRGAHAAELVGRKGIEGMGVGRF